MIKDLKAREVFDSRGNPTIECDLETENGVFSSIVPSGASTGRFEALELRDNDLKRFKGKGVLKAINNVNKIIKPKLIGMDEKDQEAIDNLMIAFDGTNNKSKLGANAILSVSMCVCRAGAKSNKLPLYRHIQRLSKTRECSLPIPSFNIINGGKHAGNELGFQEFMVFPKMAKTFREAMDMGVEVYQALKEIIKKKYGINSINVGDEGGFAPSLKTANEALELINKAILACGYSKEISINIDAAASEFYDESSKKYNLGFKSSFSDIKSSDELINYYEKLCGKYGIYSIEDPLQEEAWEDFSKMTKKIGEKLQIVGDDLLVTNTERIAKAIKLKSCNALLLKINQIGTITESINAAKLAKSAGFKVMVSHRSGETEDDFIADLAVGIAAEQIKSGAPCRSERVCKYNRLLRIEEESNIKFSGKK